MADELTKEEQWVLEEKYGHKEAANAPVEFKADRARLAAGEPVAYVIGHVPFLGLTIHLDSHPLIPRPETEWWAEQLLTHVGRQTSHMKFLDLCAGSGAIGCAALGTLPHADVFFGELEPTHRATIEKNIRMNGLDASRAHIGIGDLFAPVGGQQFDVIAANPPYIPEGRELPESVAGYEPREALYAGADGLGLIRRIAHGLPAHLAPEGIAWIECDTGHIMAARELFAAAGMQTEIMPDQYGAPRVLTACAHR